ncbi:MAG: TIGR03619 family F420-dependent LLM class oxidoreductase [Dehalococcoidia bacterium]
MRFAINVPNFGEYFDPRFAGELAADAEAHGWDGFFVWDHINAAYEPGTPLADPWILLAAIALATERIRIGTLVTPLPRRRPWTVARETVTLDHLSRGRLTLGVGLGYPPDLEYAALGEDADDRTRADRLDEGLAVLAGLWSGEPFSYEGEHYRLTDVQFLPKPVQQPRIPIWVAQMWPHRRPLRRAARWDGVVPIDPASPDMIPSVDRVREVAAYVRAHRVSDAPFDVVVPLRVDEDRAATVGRARGYEDAGATWAQVSAWSVEELRARIAAGPPRTEERPV